MAGMDLKSCTPSQPIVLDLVRQFIKDTYLKKVQAPQGVKPSLTAWQGNFRGPFWELEWTPEKRSYGYRQRNSRGYQEIAARKAS
jgi:hypothetical protein